MRVDPTPTDNDHEPALTDPPAAAAGHHLRRGKRGEARLPPASAVVVAIALYALLPQT